MHSFKIAAERRGTHTHVRVFSGRHGVTRGLAGTLIFRNEDYRAFRDGLRSGLPGSEMPEVLEIEETEDASLPSARVEPVLAGDLLAIVQELPARERRLIAPDATPFAILPR